MSSYGLNIPFLRLWKAAHYLDSSTSTEEEKDHEDNEPKNDNAELEKFNKALKRRVKELQKETTSIAKENAELKLKIDLSPSLPLSGNTLIP